MFTNNTKSGWNLVISDLKMNENIHPLITICKQILFIMLFLSDIFKRSFYDLILMSPMHLIYHTDQIKFL